VAAPELTPVDQAVEASADAGQSRRNFVDGAPKRRTALAAAGKVLNLVVLMIAVFAALVLIVVPKATGSATYTVLTNSMAPNFPPGTFLVVKPVDFDDLKYGDVITFQMYSGRPEVETHRIVGFGGTQEGEKTLVTKGDNNGFNDAEPVRELQVKGKLFYAVPYVGYAANALGNADRNMWATLGAAGLIGYGALLVFKGIRSRGRSQKAGVEGSE
jgi:signal peptidase